MYSEFADIYDTLMSDVDYEKWADFYESVFNKYSIKPELILDLGCGTGTLTGIMSGRGYDMTGIDSSCAMLNKAIVKGGNILYLNQNMEELELYGTMGAVISSLDCINYVTEEKSLAEIFRLVENYLDYDGLFVFDINSPYKLSQILGGNCYTYDENGIFYTWESFFDEKTELCDFELTFFVKNKDGSYNRIDENQIERAWSVETLTSLLLKAGFCDIEVYGDKKLEAPKENEERIFISSRKRKC